MNLRHVQISETFKIAEKKKVSEMSVYLANKNKNVSSLINAFFIQYLFCIHLSTTFISISQSSKFSHIFNIKFYQNQTKRATDAHQHKLLMFMLHVSMDETQTRKLLKIIRCNLIIKR